jgi:riboflavin kinase / FMN adenylyltransferase
MIIHQGYENLNLDSPIVTMGIFDGVHTGHKTLLDYLVIRAHAASAQSALITFSPHPRLVLEKNTSGLFFLTTIDEKLKLLEKEGIDHIILIEFSREFSNISACDFVKDVLVDKVGTRHLIIGHDHRFGRRGEGDYNTIQDCANRLNFSVEQVSGYQSDNALVSSSLIRDALLNGRLEDANKWLGYPYQITGRVVTGRKLGREIGYPTANIRPVSDHKLIPCNGVYAVDVIVSDEKYKGMLSIGTNPTVNSDPGFRSIEVHILEFNADIYGKDITVIFRKRLRDEKKFNSIEDLVLQMNRDKDDTMRVPD